MRLKAKIKHTSAQILYNYDNVLLLKIFLLKHLNKVNVEKIKTDGRTYGLSD